MDQAGEGSITFSAGDVQTTVSITVTEVPQGGSLVINEVDYDQPGEDNAEFIEIYNPTSQAVDLSTVAVELLNGSSGGQVYHTVALSSVATELPSNAFLVLYQGAVMVPNEVLQGSLMASIQNGAPDGIRLVNTQTNEVIDALSYEGETEGLSEGGVAPTESDLGDGSLARCVDGADRDNNAEDFTFTTTPTPGTANQCN